MRKTKKIGVLLSGCGFLDGAEITESVLTLLALDRVQEKMQGKGPAGPENPLPFETVIIAPNRDQYHVVNHHSGQEVSEKRNILHEAARIARGKIFDLAQLDPSTLDALLFPGGYGVAKNFSNFAFQGPKGEVAPDIAQFVWEIHRQQKPIGALCISPAVLAMLFGHQGTKGLEVTIGHDSSTQEAIRQCGGRSIEKEVDEIHFDARLKIVSTPAYMEEAKIHKIAEGIEKCVEKIVQLTFE